MYTSHIWLRGKTFQDKRPNGYAREHEIVDQSALKMTISNRARIFPPRFALHPREFPQARHPCCHERRVCFIAVSAGCRVQYAQRCVRSGQVLHRLLAIDEFTKTTSTNMQGGVPSRTARRLSAGRRLQNRVLASSVHLYVDISTNNASLSRLLSPQSLVSRHGEISMRDGTRDEMMYTRRKFLFFPQ